MPDKETLEIYLHNCFLYVSFAMLADRKFRQILVQTKQLIFLKGLTQKFFALKESLQAIHSILGVI